MYAKSLQAGSAVSFYSLIPNSSGGGGGGVTSVSAGTGMSFPVITSIGSVSIDTTKVPYIAAGFSSGLLRWNGSAWVFDTSSYVLSTRTITINGTTQDLSANRSWTVGDLVSTTLYYDPTWLASLAWSKITGAPSFLTSAIVSLNGLTGATQTFVNDTNVTIVSAGTTHTITWAGTLADGRIASATNWNTAYTNRITSLTTTGNSGSATLISNVLNIPTYTADGILPSQTGNSGKYLTTNGTTASWATITAMTNPMTTLGDIIYGGASGTPTRLGVGTNGFILQVQSGIPAWFNLFGTANTFTTTQTILWNNGVSRSLILNAFTGSSSATSFSGAAGTSVSFASGNYGIMFTHNSSFNAPWIYPIFSVANRSLLGYTATVPQIQLRISTLSGTHERNIEWAMPTNSTFTAYDVAIRYDLFNTSSSYRFVQHYMRTSIDTAGALNTASALLHLGAAATGYASLNIKTSAGTNPSAPADGDIWYDGTNLKMRKGGTTYTFTMV